jgi:hypothetical protein
LAAPGVKLYMQYGCGLSAPAGWLNFDASPTIVLQRAPVVGSLFRRPPWPVFPQNVRFGDITKGLPLDPASCAGIYCSHVLEHLTMRDTQRALQHTLQYLEPGGIFRLVVPDLEAFVREYIASDAPDASYRLLGMLDLRQQDRPRGVRERLRARFGNSHHQWMWDYRSLRMELEGAGFTDIRRATIGDSADARFRDVEEESRWTDALGIECRRPT